jgi:hypothetical protein
LFDPRSDLISLFTNSKISANSRFGSNKTVFVKLLEEKVDNKHKEIDDYGSECVGIIWMSPPRAYLEDMDIGFNTTQHSVVVDCRLIVPRNDRWLQGVHDTFINSILHTFETTIRSNGDASAGKSWDTAMATNMPVSSDPENPSINYKVIEVVCTKAN